MKILYTASEGLPYSASGGLADVAGSLPAALNALGEDCRVVLPLYGSIRQELKDRLNYITNFTVPVAWRNQYCGVFVGVENGVTYYLLDNEYYFARNGMYGFYDDAERFIFFSRAVL
ncbi:MAG: glycogen/starch synthase, partial [Ruminococcus sp.]|nr:glycogen/starch synthase [Ruminococcus sp.]